MLWKFSDRIGHVSDESGTAAFSANLTTDGLLGAGVFLVGLYAVLFGLVDAVGVEAADWMARSAENQTDFQDEVLIRNWTRRAGHLLQIGLGVGLIYDRHRAREAVAIALKISRKVSGLAKHREFSRLS